MSGRVKWKDAWSELENYLHDLQKELPAQNKKLSKEALLLEDIIKSAESIKKKNTVKPSKRRVVKKKSATDKIFEFLGLS